MQIGRRRFLGLGGAVLLGGPALLAGCGSDDAADPFVLVKRWDDTANAAGRVRLPLSLASFEDQALLSGAAGPERLTGRVVAADGAEVTRFEAPRHAGGIANPYWPINLDIGTAGVYTLLVDEGDPNGLAFQLFDTADVATPAHGTPLPPFETPTIDDERGVDPVCTLTPNPCPFHEVTLAEALASGKHVVYMVGTPAHCQFGTCAPGLEFLIEAAPAFTDRAVFVHADVFTDDTATEVAPAVRALNLDYEPVIYVTDRSGLVTDRMDVVWDLAELQQVLERNLS